MKYWSYNEPIFSKDGEVLGNIVITKSEEEIINEYLPYWSERMIEKYGEDEFLKLFCDYDCIMDWVVINWAWETEND